jgi:hypothetical protein
MAAALGFFALIAFLCWSYKPRRLNEPYLHYAAEQWRTIRSGNLLERESRRVVGTAALDCGRVPLNGSATNLRSDLSLPERTNQCALTTNAVAADNADARSECGPRNTTNGEPSMKRIVATALAVAGTAPCPVKLIPSYGHTALNAARKASHPGSQLGLAAPLTIGRNQAAAWNSHAAKIRRWALLILSSKGRTVPSSELGRSWGESFITSYFARRDRRR